MAARATLGPSMVGGAVDLGFLVQIFFSLTGSLCSSSTKMMSCLMLALIVLVVDEFRNAPSEILSGCLTPIDIWIEWDSVVCALISARMASRWRETKLHVYLHSGTCRYFVFNGEDSNTERHGDSHMRPWNGGSSLRGDENFAW
uniref:Uncharacterized protein n=1 Tax=Hordeum vulgare subsp. vulgare TaxID=112509 RepID=Q8S406_HORVV|nr:Hypothetical protein [Hordeum vulgare subsp. vulgare]